MRTEQNRFKSHNLT